MIIASRTQFQVYLPWGQRLFSIVHLNRFLNVKEVVATFNQQKALVGAFSVIMNLRMELFEALINKHKYINSCHGVTCCPRDGHGTTEHQKLRCNVDIPTTTTTAATTATNNNNSSRD